MVTCAMHQHHSPAYQRALDPDSLWFKFSTRTCMTYYIEVPYWSGLLEAIDVLKKDFGIDATISDIYEEGPLVNKIEVITDPVPSPDNVKVFVGKSRWFDCM